MTTKKPVSHIMVISNDFNITDLGEYRNKDIRQMFGLPQAALIIDYPMQHEKKYFLSTSDDIGIMEMMSCSNKNSHCLIFGSMAGEPIKQEDGLLYRVRPYFTKENREEIITNMVRIWSEQNDGVDIQSQKDRKHNQRQKRIKTMLTKLRKQLIESKERSNEGTKVTYPLDEAVHLNEEWGALCGYKHSAGERLVLTILRGDVTCPNCIEYLRKQKPEIELKRLNPIVERMKQVIL